MDGEKEIIDALSSHEKREQEKLAREEAREQKDEQKELKQRRKNYFWIIVTIIALIAFALVVGWLYTHRPQTYTDREIHWHMYFDITVCGEHRDLPRANSGDMVHGERYRGIPMLHTHDDNIAHIEGLVQKKEDISLGRFMDVIDLPFDKDKIFEYKNGDKCPDGSVGTLKMYVNNKPSSAFRDYIPFATQDARKQVIKLVFGPEEPIENNTTNSSS